MSYILQLSKKAFSNWKLKTVSNKHSWTRPAPWPDSLGCFFLSPGYAARSGCSGNGCCERSEVKRQFSLAASKVHWVVTRGMCPALSRPGRNCFSVRVLQRWNAGWELLCPPYLSPWLSAALCFSCAPIFIYLFSAEKELSLHFTSPW